MGKKKGTHPNPGLDPRKPPKNLFVEMAHTGEGWMIKDEQLGLLQASTFYKINSLMVIIIYISY